MCEVPLRHNEFPNHFTQTQPTLSLQEYNVKLQKIYAVKAEVKSHIDNLPDVSQLPDVTGGLAPLPSAGDLFSIWDLIDTRLQKTSIKVVGIHNFMVEGTGEYVSWLNRKLRLRYRLSLRRYVNLT